ncbi:hypothetical protein ACEW7V_00620 [Areca yellow leaf disease phytoplasma]|uniref:hypothetical protein n=1 Tax=Areca yellow leaf disease phytoplasma TaxID=927614 RepID=UPI0035B55BB7
MQELKKEPNTTNTNANYNNKEASPKSKEVQEVEKDSNLENDNNLNQTNQNRPINNNTTKNNENNAPKVQEQGANLILLETILHFQIIKDQNSLNAFWLKSGSTTPNLGLFF